MAENGKEDRKAAGATLGKHLWKKIQQQKNGTGHPNPAPVPRRWRRELERERGTECGFTFFEEWVAKKEEGQRQGKGPKGNTS